MKKKKKKKTPQCQTLAGVLALRLAEAADFHAEGERLLCKGTELKALGLPGRNVSLAKVEMLR